MTIKKLLFVAATLLIGGGSVQIMAQGSWSAPAVPGSDISTTNTGAYAIYNIKADAFMGEGMNYNTEAIACRLENGYAAALANRQKFTLTVEGATVKMVHNNHTDRGVGCASTGANDIYADYGSNNVWTYATSTNYSNAYTLTLTGYGTLDVDDKWGGKLTTSEGMGYTDWAFIPETSLTDGSFAKWKERKAMYDVYAALVSSGSATTYSSALETANAVYNNSSATVSDLRAATRTLIIAAADGIQEPTNVTALFTNADMQQDGTTDWTSDNVDRSAGAIENHWASTAITLTQSKTDIPNGLYTLVFRGMYRTGSGDTPYFQAISNENNTQVSLPLMSDIASRWSVRGTGEWAGDDNSKIPNKLWRAAEGLAYDEASAKIENFKVTGNTLTLTVKVTSTAQWVPFQSFDIIYSGPTNLALYKQVAEKKAEAETLLPSAETIGASTSLENAINSAAALNSSSEESDLNSALTALVDAIDFVNTCAAPHASFTALKASAELIASVAYHETTTGSHTTFSTTITTLTSVEENATSVAAINTAISNLKDAIKTYIANAEPANDGEYFDITCLMVNPAFDNNSKTGWSYLSAPGVSWDNCEYYESEFDINQTVTGLPTGSYSLSVQAFQRPGWAGAVWTAYNGGTDEASSVLYINSITSNVKNIMADAQDSPKLDKIEGKNYGDWPYDSQVGTEGSYKYIPNSQQGAKLYFDAGLYDATCAAVVTEGDGGSLKLGFKSTKSHVSGDWTIFDNFRLYYYGSSLLIYYKQYLPQLKTEAGADLGNALYANVTGVERSDFETALAAIPASETESDYKDVIDAIIEKQTAFRAARNSYDALVAAKAATLTKVSANIGTGVFQYNEITNDNLWSAYETAKAAVDNYTVTTTSTASAIQDIVDAYNTAVSNYNNQALNAPTDTRYNVTIVEAGKEWNGNAITFVEGGRNDQGLYGVKYLTAANTNYNQALKFTATGTPNTYKVSALRPDGTEQYLTTGTTYGGNNDQIRTTNDASAAMLVKIIATATDGQFQLYNVAAGKVIANNDNNDMYTANSASFTIAEATQASAILKANAGKFGTFIAPFAVTIPAGIEAYKVTAVTDGKLTLEAVSTTIPANTAVVVKNTNGTDYNQTVNGWGTAKADSYVTELLTGVYTAATILASADNTTNYVLQTAADKTQAFYKVDADFTATPNRCYLTVTTSGEAKPRVLYFDEADATAIDEIVNGQSVNGQSIYNLNGQQLNSLQRGINIVGGKKVLVK